MKILNRTILTVFYLLCVVVQLFATYKASLISTDRATYDERKDGIYFKYIPTSSNLYKTGISIGDKLIYVNDIKIENKHYLFNLIFDRIEPSSKVVYKVLEGEKIKTVILELEKRFSIFELVFSLFLGISFLTLIFLIIFHYPPSKTLISFFFLFLTLSFISVFINVPFSNKILYSMFIFLCFINQISLFIFTKNFLINIKYNIISYSILIIFVFAILFWMGNYIHWTFTLYVEDYKKVMQSLKLFQFAISLNMIHSIILIMNKVLKLYEKGSPVEYFATSYLFIFILLTYPIFYSLPIILRKRELVPFYFFFLFYYIALILMLRYKNKLYKVFL
ncbi:MAG: hypothetical protein XD76_0437 [candidate division TA06 bacterium 32_111]|uniref:PDZ domain-containing protein n=2 Tax=Bacteria candidate phyla TaxID=1783234 RepID=A0A101I2T1_UNCT6|nr:MAG: hypothetical protein XD76_0437 [candidate division TA06 bacterium 32_111]KUK87329.1 MAG: hypothetical protein XE03_0727 [candidate division TA06 bacterium 34_109]HAF07838.1 hypothetical protein [candidate division WOR-3 bacterium]HCP17356.1 hypothetical protein [candidate division WOR-3 bacterium]